LPLILRVRFTNIDLKEIGAVFVISVKFDEVADPATKWRSSVAAENQDERFCADAIAQVKCIDAIELVKFRVTGAIANAEVAAVHVGKRIADEAVNIFGAAGNHAEKCECQGEENSKANGGPFQNATLLGGHGVPLF